MSIEIQELNRSQRVEDLSAIRQILDHALGIADHYSEVEGWQLLSELQANALYDVRHSILASEIVCNLAVTNNCDYIVGFAEIVRQALDEFGRCDATQYAERIEAAWRIPEQASLTHNEVQAISDRVESGRWPIDPPFTLEEFRREVESEQRRLGVERNLSWQLCGF